jgi:hypothetical protein
VAAAHRADNPRDGNRPVPVGGIGEEREMAQTTVASPQNRAPVERAITQELPVLSAPPALRLTPIGAVRDQ